MFFLIKNQRGTNLLIIDADIYTVKKRNSNTIQWRWCERSKGCKVLVTTPKDIEDTGSSENFKFSNEHNHGVLSGNITRLINRENMRNSSIQSRDNARIIITENSSRQRVFEIAVTGSREALG